MTAKDDGIPDDDGTNFLDTVNGEVALFRSVMRARPVGIHRHFHVLTICNAILKDTGRLVSVEDVWNKLRTCYDLTILENIEVDGYNLPGSSGPSTPTSIPMRSPSPSQNLSGHPWFRHEFTLPSEEPFESMIARRRMRMTASIPSSSPAASPSNTSRQAAGAREGKQGRNKRNNTAGLVEGDSDSSALTPESGDESIAPTPRESNATATDGGTDYAGDDDADAREHSPATKFARKSTKSTRRGGGTTRARGASTAAGRGTKRKKK